MNGKSFIMQPSLNQNEMRIEYSCAYLISARVLIEIKIKIKKKSRRRRLKKTVVAADDFFDFCFLLLASPQPSSPYLPDAKDGGGRATCKRSSNASQ